MTESQIQKIIKLKYLNPDELDKDKYFGYFPSIAITLAFLIPIMPFVKNNTSINLMVSCICIILGLSLTYYTYHLFKTEKRLISIKTNLSKELNQKLIQSILVDEHLEFDKKKHYIVALLPNIIHNKGLKAIFIASENEILFNIRTKSFARNEGRIPYSIGKIIQEKKYRNLIPLFIDRSA